MRYVDVILPLPLEGTFTYAVGEGLGRRVEAGMRVLVPLGRSKTYMAIVTRVHDDRPAFDVKEVIHIPDDRPMLLPQQLKLWRWIADYYLCPLGDVYKAALPAGLKAEEGYRPRTETYVTLGEDFRSGQVLHVAQDLLRNSRRQREVLATYLQLSGWDRMLDNRVPDTLREVTREELMNEAHATMPIVRALTDRRMLTLYEKPVSRLNVGGEPHWDQMKPLTEAQQQACDAVEDQMKHHQVVLLHGVTSSGKTELYIHLIHRALQEGRQVLYLLPEIALTVQITSRLQRVFGGKLGIYHSKYSDAERAEIWQRQLSDSPYEVILGVRSSVFLPFRRLGLVIIDEEHETSYKQQEPAPRYHARSAAIMLAQMYGAKTLLGTATPSVESYYNARTGKYGLVELMTRYKGLQLPEIRVIDLAQLHHRKMMRGPFSPQLLHAIRGALAADEQVILFQNRRGFAPMIECRVCGWVPKCKNCDVSLTLHKSLNVLTCHYCGYTYPVPTVCPNCGSTELKSRGFGTEKIEDAIREEFPDVRVARMDLDTTRTRNAYERIIGDFAAGKTRLLIGTQMVSKGLDFDKVSVVGILNADSMLNYPDFRAYEQAFMMMAQVSGRAGRKGKRGHVYLQTRSKDLPVIRQVVDNDWQGFFRDVLQERRDFHYPPFTRLIYVYLRHARAETVETAAIEMGSRLRQWLGTRVLGPDKPAVARVKTLHIRKIVLKLETGLDLHGVREGLRQIQQQIMQDRHYATLQIYYDVDPL